MKSNCCNAEAISDVSTEGTGCYLCNKCGLPCDAVLDNDNTKILIEAYKLGYADRNAKMVPFQDQDPKEYIEAYLKNL